MKTDDIDKQNEQKKNWLTHPTKQNLLIIMAVWFVGNTLLILSATNFFTNSFFDTEYVMSYFMIILTTWTTFKIILNYFKTKGTDTKKL